MTAREMTGHALDHLQRMNDRPDGMEGVSTGWPSLDKLTRGLEPSSLIILAARPSMGKTTFGVQLAQQVAEKADKPVLIEALAAVADNDYFERGIEVAIETAALRIEQQGIDAWFAIDAEELLGGPLDAWSGRFVRAGVDSVASLRAAAAGLDPLARTVSLIPYGPSDPVA